jgi:competence protein ComEA
VDNPIEFSKRSRRAILIFVILLVFLVLIPRALSLFDFEKSYHFHQTDFEKNNYTNFKFKKKKYKKYTYQKYDKHSKFKTPSKKFDPNTYSINDWMKLGMSQKQADLILKFGKRGFYSDEDLKKVFVISDKFFQVIRDSLVYPEKKSKENSSFEKNLSLNASQKTQIIELNTANEKDLLTLKGIGPFFAKNIIKKRNEFGGFIKKEQLLEVWKLDQEKLNAFEMNLSINPTLIQQLPLNSVSDEDLKKHPYITWNVANSIVKIREQLGGFQSIEDIKRSVLINEELYNKLKPYLTL